MGWIWQELGRAVRDETQLAAHERDEAVQAASFLLDTRRARARRCRSAARMASAAPTSWKEMGMSVRENATRGTR